jgi:cobalt-zinc-cadmium efflux system membrane fusion protein
VVFDIHGGTWVYEQLGEYRYARRRVVIGHSVGADAVLASGPATGTNVVSAGAQELFGAETGFVK